jgi:hypothetical protein
VQHEPVGRRQQLGLLEGHITECDN